MTRRLTGRGRTLTIDAYIRRATVGLPKTQRLDAAAELRTHLLERVAEHQAQGFSPEEAEYLAVKGMGEPQPVNRHLLGHALTHRAGWGALALLLVGGVGWYGYREWMPPREGVLYGKATPEDISRLFADRDAPRGTYQAMTLTYPRATRSVVYAKVASSEVKNGNDDVQVFTKDVAYEETRNIVGRVPGSYRYQERLLLTEWPMKCAGQDRSGIFATSQTLPSRFWNTGGSMVTGLGSVVGACNNPSVRLHVVWDEVSTVPPQRISRSVRPFGSGSLMQSGRVPQALPLNQWTVLMRLGVDPAANPNSGGAQTANGYSGKARGVYLAVLPLDREVKDVGGHSYGAGVIRITGDDRNLPLLPPTVPGQPLP